MKRQGGACFLVVTRAVLGVPGHLLPLRPALRSSLWSSPQRRRWTWVALGACPTQAGEQSAGLQSRPRGDTSPRAGLGGLTTGCDGPAIEQEFLPPCASASAPHGEPLWACPCLEVTRGPHDILGSTPECSRPPELKVWGLSSQAGVSEEVTLASESCGVRPAAQSR